MTAVSPPIVDAHHHLWDPDIADYPWMTGDHLVLSRPYGTADLEPHLRATGVTATIVVEARTELDETTNLLETAARTGWIAGVVGWVDLTEARVSETIGEILERPDGGKLVGIRHPVHDEPDPEWLLRDDVTRGLAAVEQAGLSYDLLVKPRELPAATEVARRFPGLRLVVDHMAKPPIATGQTEPWASLMSEIARLPNVTCKVSGLVTEASWTSWTPDDLRPYVVGVVEMFGPERLMFGSDWPVCTLAAAYEEVIRVTVETLTQVAGDRIDAILGLNAITTYLGDKEPSSI
jgi:L-fucono-1,5-lactonase